MSRAARSSKASTRASCERGVDQFGRAVRQCKLCKCFSTDPSPYVSALPTDIFMGCRPWAKTKPADRMINMVIMKVRDPDGKICNISLNLYRILVSQRFRSGCDFV